MQIIAYARASHEFDTRDALRWDGFSAIVPRRVEPVSRGKERRPKLEDAPLLPNYVFIDLSADGYHRLIRSRGKYKWMAGTFLTIPIHLERAMSRWAETVEAEAQRELDRYRRGEELSLFSCGEAVRITEGPFAEWIEGQNITFRRMVQAAHDTFPRAEVEVELFGRIARLEVDPLHVRKA